MDKTQIPIVVLCGGRGVVFREKNDVQAKALIQVGSKAMLEHVINFYKGYGFEKFLLACGSEYPQIKAWGEGFASRNPQADIRAFDTGADAPTGHRLWAVREHLQEADVFGVSYSDILSDVDLNDEFEEHLESGKIATLVAAHMPTRFRILGFRPGESLVRGFADRPVDQSDWINGGYYFFNQSIFEIDSFKENSVIETDMLEELVRKEELNAYKFDGRWQHMDSERHLAKLEKIAGAQS